MIRWERTHPLFEHWIQDYMTLFNLDPEGSSVFVMERVVFMLLGKPDTFEVLTSTTRATMLLLEFALHQMFCLHTEAFKCMLYIWHHHTLSITQHSFHHSHRELPSLCTQPPWTVRSQNRNSFCCSEQYRWNKGTICIHVTFDGAAPRRHCGL